MEAIIVSIKSPTPHQLATKPITPSGYFVTQSTSTPLLKIEQMEFISPIPEGINTKPQSEPMIIVEITFGI